MNHCITCGMPLDNKEFIGTKVDLGLVCKFCTNKDGTVKSCNDIFNGGVHFFITSIAGTDKAMAEKAVRKNMNRLPYWKNSNEHCLKGEELTDEEFHKLLKKLHT